MHDQGVVPADPLWGRLLQRRGISLDDAWLHVVEPALPALLARPAWHLLSNLGPILFAAPLGHQVGQPLMLLRSPPVQRAQLGSPGAA